MTYCVCTRPYQCYQRTTKKWKLCFALLHIHDLLFYSIYGNIDYNTVMHKCLIILTLVARSPGADAALQHRGGHGAGPHVRARRGGGRLLL
jgi:hypothetical protein